MNDDLQKIIGSMMSQCKTLDMETFPLGERVLCALKCVLKILQIFIAIGAALKILVEVLHRI